MPERISVDLDFFARYFATTTIVVHQQYGREIAASNLAVTLIKMIKGVSITDPTDEDLALSDQIMDKIEYYLKEYQVTLEAEKLLKDDTKFDAELKKLLDE